MPMIQPEYEYQAQQKLSKLRHEAQVARITNGLSLGSYVAHLLCQAAARLERFAQRLTPGKTPHTAPAPTKA